MYPPEEDSFLLLEQVKKYAQGKVLDIGTGCGIQAIEAAKKQEVKSVLAVDIEKKIINSFRKTINVHKKLGLKSSLLNPKIKFVVSDLFSNVWGKYDTIIFNPPYLPQDKRIEDKALYGGKKGYELLEKFFSKAGNYLEKEGIILLVFSSFTGRDKVNKIIADNNFSFIPLAHKHIFFEDLYVYLIKNC